MSLWLVRAGRHGEQENTALNESVVTIGWDDLPNLEDVKTRENLRSLYVKTYPDAKKNTVSNEVGQVWTFINRINKGDLVALPLKKQASIAIGRVESEGYPLNQSVELVETLLEIIKSRLSSGEDVLISGFGKFSAKEKRERRGRNPATGDDMMLKAEEGCEVQVLTAAPG